MADEPDDHPPQDLERKLATILSADVAEYSRLMAEDEEGTLRTFRAHRQVFESLVALHRGRIFNTAGDAILAEFASTVEAVRCATEIQAALRTRNDQLTPSRQVNFRIGVNLGDVMVHGQDLLGDGVNIAARLQAAAEPGGICISGSVHDQIRNKLSLSFKPMGERSFKNIPQPVTTYSITEAEGLGVLPAPKTAWRGFQGISARWVAVAVIVVAAGGYWAYADIQRNKVEQSRIARLIAERRAAEQAERQALDLARQKAEPGHAWADEGARRTRAEEEARRSADAERKRADARQEFAAVTPHPTPAPPAAPGPSASVGLDGIYSGPVCFGAAGTAPARCFRGQATVSQGKIAGEWPNPNTAGTTYLTGEVSASGDVKIEIHADAPDGTRASAAELAGTLRDGRLDATGSFRNGRTASLDWHKHVSAPGSDAGAAGMRPRP